MAMRRVMDEPNLLRALLLLHQLTIGLSRTSRESLWSTATSNQELRVLSHVGEAGISTPGQIATALGTRATVVSRILATLAQDNLVSISPNPADGRSRLVTLTRSGRARVRRHQSRLNGYLSESRPLIEQTVAALGAGASPGEAASVSKDRPITEILARAGAAYVMQVTPVSRGYGIFTTDERFALCEIAAAVQIRPKELGEVLEISSGHTSNILNRLEDAGLIERSHVPQAGDRRAVVVTATDRGRRAVTEILQVLDANATQLAAALSAALAPSLTRASGQ
jgi:DNA-binding MarR family transcriptional regulator